MHVTRGKRSRFTHESKFTERINTEVLASGAHTEGEALRVTLDGRRILDDLREPWHLKNAYRL